MYIKSTNTFQASLPPLLLSLLYTFSPTGCVVSVFFYSQHLPYSLLNLIPYSERPPVLYDCISRPPLHPSRLNFSNYRPILKLMSSVSGGLVRDQRLSDRSSPLPPRSITFIEPQQQTLPVVYVWLHYLEAILHRRSPSLEYPVCTQTLAITLTSLEASIFMPFFSSTANEMVLMRG